MTASAIVATKVMRSTRSAADAVGEPAAHGARDHGQQGESGGAVAGVGLGEVVHATSSLGR